MQKSPEHPSRREFLKAGLALSGSFLLELALPSVARAELEKILNTQEYRMESFDALIASLKKAVWDNHKEAGWAHVVKGDKEYSVNIIKAGAHTSAEFINIAPIFMDRRVSNVSIVHTHPASIFETYPILSKREIQKIRAERKTTLSLLPSGTDIVEYIAQKTDLEDRNIRHAFRDFVVEPSGVWSYDGDIRHPFFERGIAPRMSEFSDRSSALLMAHTLRQELNDYMEEWQTKVFRGGGMTPKLFDALNTDAKNKYGISFTYEK